MSDAPYGIRGMANNIQQLASNLFFMSKKTVEATGKTVGFGGAVKSLVGGLWGATGALVAFQGLIALWDWYSNRTDKATDSTEDATNATKDLSSELKSLEKILSDSGLSLGSYNKKIEDYIKLKVQQKKLDESILKTAVKIEEQRKIDSDSLADDIALAEKLKQAKKDSADQALIIYEDTAIGRQAKKQAVDHSVTIQQIQSRISNNILVRAAAQKEIIRLTKEELDDITKIENAKKELAKAEVGTLKFLKEELSDKKKIREITASTNKEYEKQSIKIAEIQKQIDKIEGKGKLKPIVVGLELESKGVEDVVSGLPDILSDEPVLIPIEFNPITPEYDEVAEFIEHYKTLMSGLTDFIDGEFERELTIEKNKTNAINAELNNRLNNENLSKDQRASIQNQIAQNDEKLRVKQEAIARKQFKVTKAFNIAMTIADTYMAAQKAYLSQMTFDPTAPIRAKIAAGIAVASGLAKVAAISRTTFQSTAPSTPTNIGGGGSLSGGGRSESSFNIVGGRTKEDALLGAIQAQFDQPLKAYVVSGDVTSQQELDRVIVSSSSL
jgi:hypothetical protein